MCGKWLKEETLVEDGGEGFCSWSPRGVVAEKKRLVTTVMTQPTTSLPTLSDGISRNGLESVSISRDPRFWKLVRVMRNRKGCLGCAARWKSMGPSDLAFTHHGVGRIE